MPNNSRAEKLEALGRIIDTLDILRVKCPWDAKQTNESLRPNTIEEVYELTQALMDNNSTEIRKELGDVLLHILFYAKIGDENGQFDIADVADALNDKLIFRHPHVFGDTKVKDAEQLREKDDHSNQYKQTPDNKPEPLNRVHPHFLLSYFPAYGAAPRRCRCKPWRLRQRRES